MKYGDTIVVNEKYVRRSRWERDKLGNSRLRKEWLLVPYRVDGIYLGTRTLQNGWSDYDDECGSMWAPIEHFRVSLVSPSKNKNPIYVPFVKPSP